jgi:regulatory protein
MSGLRKIFSVDKYKGSTYCVEFEDGDKIYLNSEFISKYSLRDGVEIPGEALDEIIFENDFRRARERALYLLEYRDHSYKELNDKLMRNYSDEICEAVMEKMCQLGLIDDEKYAEKLAAKLVEVKKYGKYRARFEMHKKGIDRELIDELLEQYEEETEERLEALVERKYSRYLVDRKGVTKVTNALARLGYSYSDIKAVLENFMDEVED